MFGRVRVNKKLTLTVTPFTSHQRDARHELDTQVLFSVALLLKPDCSFVTLHSI